VSKTDQLAPAYHAHIYFDGASRDRAWALRERIVATFPTLQVGHFHERNVGPHPRWSCQVLFDLGMFAAFVPWLMLNRYGLTLFLHPTTDDALADHQQFPIWMGESLELDLEMFNN